jgi:hypothetical protein
MALLSTDILEEVLVLPAVFPYGPVSHGVAHFTRITWAMLFFPYNSTP